MRAFYIPLSILITSLLLSLWAAQHTRQQTEGWLLLLSQSEAFAREEHWSQAETCLQDAYQGWTRSQAILHTIMSHQDLEDAESLFAGVTVTCREQDSIQFQWQLAQLMVQLRHLSESQALSLQNIL